jgi:hypothetical protein
MSRLPVWLFVAFCCPFVTFSADLPKTDRHTLDTDDAGESPFGREQWFIQQRLNKKGEVGARERLRALEWREHQQAVGDAAFPGQNWQLIGPEPESVKQIPISAGRVTALVVDPTPLTPKIQTPSTQARARGTSMPMHTSAPAF